MPESSILDPDSLDRLREWGGSELLGRMIRIFLDHAPGRVEEIRSGLGGGELREAEKGAHSLKSSAGNLGATRLREICARIEDLAADGERSEAEGAMDELEGAYREASDALTDLLASVEDA